MSAAADGVNRDGLEYRAGWVEALRALATRLAVEGLRAPKREGPGLERAADFARISMNEMLDKMRGGSLDSLDKPPTKKD